MSLFTVHTVHINHSPQEREEDENKYLHKNLTSKSSLTQCTMGFSWLTVIKQLHFMVLPNIRHIHNVHFWKWSPRSPLPIYKQFNMLRSIFGMKLFGEWMQAFAAIRDRGKTKNQINWLCTAARHISGWTILISHRWNGMNIRVINESYIVSSQSMNDSVGFSECCMCLCVFVCC